MSDRGMRAFHLVLVAPLVVVALATVHAGRAVRSDPADVLVALRAAAGPTLPDAAKVPGATCSEPTRYDRETLYELIDGAAEAYLERGFERCVTADYQVGAGTDVVEVGAEVHRFATAAGAADQLMAEKPMAAVPVAGLDDTVADAQVLFARRGRDLLKLVALSGGAGAPATLVRIARAWKESR